MLFKLAFLALLCQHAKFFDIFEKHLSEVTGQGRALKNALKSSSANVIMNGDLSLKTNRLFLSFVFHSWFSPSTHIKTLFHSYFARAVLLHNLPLILFVLSRYSLQQFILTLF